LSGYAVAHLEEIDELDDGRCPWRPVRHHLGISAFGINAWTARDVGDRIINEHDESDDGSEELYLVTGGRAVFELDGERLDAPAGMLVFVRSGVKRTAFAEEPGTTIVAVGGVPGKAYEPVGWEVWGPPQTPLRGRVQPRLLREPRGPDDRRDRAPPAGDRAVGAVSCPREGGLGLRSDSRRARLQGTDRRLSGARADQ
jgi:hypothetical protein